MASDTQFPVPAYDAQDSEVVTTSQGTPLPDIERSLKVGRRGPTLLADHHLREKIMHFDHERIPERVVHARGAGAHGAAGDLTGNEKLQSEGKADQAAGNVKEFVSDVADKAEDVVDKVKDAFRKD